MSEKIDILIKNANIIDPEKGVIKKGNVAISNGKFIEYDMKKSYSVNDQLDAEGYYISPGWIDSHTHIFKDVTEPGFAADLGLIPMGVTTTIDGGSSGIATWPAFKKNIVDESYLNIFYSINVSPAGQITERYPENVDPLHYDADKLRELMKIDSVHVRGLKLRYGSEVVEPFGNDVLDKTIQLANKLNCAITLHVTNPPCPMEEILPKMRPGDVICHIYQGKSSTIIDADGKVKSAVFEARERGVYFDSADARINHCYSIIKSALKQGFKPDIISTDLTKNGIFSNMCWGLPVVLSKWLNLGLSLDEVIAACTYNPAKIHHLPDGIGTFNHGAAGNATIFSVEDKEFDLKNRMGEDFHGNKLIVPQVTIINGSIRYKSLMFPL